jgi:hypothetical protein
LRDVGISIPTQDCPAIDADGKATTRKRLWLDDLASLLISLAGKAPETMPIETTNRALGDIASLGLEFCWVAHLVLNEERGPLIDLSIVRAHLEVAGDKLLLSATDSRGSASDQSDDLSSITDKLTKVLDEQHASKIDAASTDPPDSPPCKTETPL